MKRNIAIGISAGTTVSFGVICLIMTIGHYVRGDVVMDDGRFVLYLLLFLISLAQWILIVKGTEIKIKKELAGEPDVKN